MPEGDDDDVEDNVYNDDNDDRRGRLVANRGGYDEGKVWSRVGERRERNNAAAGDVNQFQFTPRRRDHTPFVNHTVTTQLIS